MSTSTLKVHI